MRTLNNTLTRLPLRLAAIIFLLACTWLPAASVKIAVVGAHQDPLADLAVAAMSELPGVELVERQDLSKVLAEYLVAGRAENHARLSNLLAADAVCFLQHQDGNLRVRLFHARTGVTLGDLTAPATIKTLPVIVRQTVQNAIGFLKTPRSDQRYLALLPIRNEAPGSGLDPSARALTALLANRLPAIPGIALVERHELQLVVNESALAADDRTLQVAAYLLEIGLRRDGPQLQASVQLRHPSGTLANRTVHRFDHESTAELSDRLLQSIAVMLKREPTETAVSDPKTEAAAYLERLRWHVSHREADRAESYAEAAIALDPRPETYKVAIEAYAGCPPSMRQQLPRRLQRELRFQQVINEHVDLLLRAGRRVRPSHPFFVRQPIHIDPEDPAQQRLYLAVKRAWDARYQQVLRQYRNDHLKLLPFLLGRLAVTTQNADSADEFVAEMIRLRDACPPGLNGFHRQRYLVALHQQFNLAAERARTEKWSGEPIGRFLKAVASAPDQVAAALAQEAITFLEKNPRHPDTQTAADAIMQTLQDPDAPPDLEHVRKGLRIRAESVLMSAGRLKPEPRQTGRRIHPSGGLWESLDLRQLPFKPIGELTDVQLEQEGAESPLTLVSRNANQLEVRALAISGASKLIASYPVELAGPIVRNDDEAIVVTEGAICRIRGRDVRRFGSEAGVPAVAAGTATRLGDTVYIAYPSTIAAFDLGSNQCRIIATSRATDARHPLDGGSAYRVWSLLPDPRQNLLWISISCQRGSKRSGIWQYSPTTGRVTLVRQGRVDALAWNNRHLFFQAVHPHAFAEFAMIGQYPFLLLDTDTGTLTQLTGVKEFTLAVRGVIRPGWAAIDNAVASVAGYLHQPDGTRFRAPDGHPLDSGWKSVLAYNDGLIITTKRDQIWQVSPKAK